MAHIIDSYCIPGQNNTKSKLQFYEIQFANTSFFIFLKKKTLHATHFLKLFDKICKYEMDPASIVEDTEGTPFCPQMDRRTRWNQCIPPPSREYDYYIHTSKGSWCQGIMGKCPAQFTSHCYGISFVEYVFESHYLPHHYGQSSPYCVILDPHTLINKYA